LGKTRKPDAGNLPAVQGMTPLEVVNAAARYFERGGFCYSFDVPDDKSLRNFPANIRQLAKARGYRWRVAYWGSGRTFLIKQKSV